MERKEVGEGVGVWRKEVGKGKKGGGEVYKFHKSPLPVLQLSMRCHPLP